MASPAINPTSEDMSTHVFPELSASAKESCETCHGGPAAYRWVRQQPGVTAGGIKLICRLCASLIVLAANRVGSPCVERFRLLCAVASRISGLRCP